MYSYIHGQMCAHIQAHVLVEMASNYATFPGEKVRQDSRILGFSLALILAKMSALYLYRNVQKHVHISSVFRSVCIGMHVYIEKSIIKGNTHVHLSLYTYRICPSPEKCRQ